MLFHDKLLSKLERTKGLLTESTESGGGGNHGYRGNETVVCS